MMWKLKISAEAKSDYKNLDKSVLKQVFAGIIKVSQNPLPRPDGYGKPLGSLSGNNLTSFFKIKYKKIGIRVVYSLVLDKHIMNILVVSRRDDDCCYRLAKSIYQKYGDSVFKDIFEDF